MGNLQSTSGGDIEKIMEIRECTNNEQSRRNPTIPCELTSEPQTHVCVSQSPYTAVDMVVPEENPPNSNKDKKLKNNNRKPPPPGIKDDLTVIAHFCLGMYVAIICYLCFSNPFTFFTWHPLLLTIGVSNYLLFY